MAERFEMIRLTVPQIKILITSLQPRVEAEFTMEYLNTKYPGNGRPRSEARALVAHLESCIPDEIAAEKHRKFPDLE